LEDNLSDRELVRRTLAGPEPAFAFVYAASEAEFTAALARDKFGLILSDFTLPDYNGTAALALARKMCPDVPYLFVSGTLTEEQAIESLLAGATDYVLKDRPERLGPAVRRALREAGERARRRVAEDALRRTEARFRDIFENSVEGIYQSTREGRFLDANRAMARLCGYASPEELCAEVRDIARDLYVDRARRLDFVQRLDDLGEVLAYESQIRRKDGTAIWISQNARAVRGAQGELLHYEGMVTDITARKASEEALQLSEQQRGELEAQLLQAQKMEAVGQLAGGIAHDFNNVLTVVIGYARLLLDEGKVPRDAVDPLTQIYNAGNRAANLTRQLLVFSRKQPVNRQIINLNGVADEIFLMLRPLIGEHIGLDRALSPAPCLVEADTGMIEQVLMNLAVNARDAMPQGGTLSIATMPVTVANAASRRHPEARTGEFICLSMCDTGCGIAPEILSRIFEPFFTTKDVGHGTGLGLAMAFGIVKQHHGWIEVESSVGVGTCFRILLPAVQQAAAVPAPHAPAMAASARGSETLLLVEDETSVREFAAAVLRSHGYRVLQACSGIEALEVWKWHGPRVALLVTDLVMPEGLGGVELAARLRQERPALRVVLSSGYANEVIGEKFRPPAGTHFIAKPYKPQALAEIVRGALDDIFDR
jgi:PAS domain S-box-containing protein